MKKNELERILIMAEKALVEMAAQSKVPGMKFDKGTEYETKMKWLRAIGGIAQITSYFRGKKALETNCKGCKYYTGSGSGWGVCSEGSGRKETMHQYDACSKYEDKEVHDEA